jgi:hypothetical protein
MAETAGSGGPTITGTVAFYKKPEPLQADRHGRLGLKRVDRPYQFAQATGLVPITIGEFSHAGLDYPIIFAEGDRMPLVVMSLMAGQNDFIDQNGEYERYRYVPAFIRRYPFVFAEDNANNRMIACIDVQAPMVGENAESPLFVGAEPTQLTRDAVGFLTTFEQQRRDTQAFVKRLADLDLFDHAEVTIPRTNPDGSPAEPINVGKYVGVSNKKLEALSDSTLGELHKSGHLGAIFVHLHSLRNWNWLIQRAGDRANAQRQAGGVN